MHMFNLPPAAIELDPKMCQYVLWYIRKSLTAWCRIQLPSTIMQLELEICGRHQEAGPPNLPIPSRDSILASDIEEGFRQSR